MLRVSIRGGGFQEAAPSVKWGVNKLIYQKLNELKGSELDAFVEKFDSLLAIDAKNQLWENNHFNIIMAMNQLMTTTARMPTTNEIADKTGLSRQTVHKHLKGYADHPVYAEQMQKLKIMASSIMSSVATLAINGDIKAARIYFDLIGKHGQQGNSTTSIQNQNNYIQINETVLSQESIKQLSTEQLNQIEGILNLKNLPSIGTI